VHEDFLIISILKDGLEVSFCNFDRVELGFDTVLTSKVFNSSTIPILFSIACTYYLVFFPVIGTYIKIATACRTIKAVSGMFLNALSSPMSLLSTCNILFSAKVN
jgi:hypothetical protein